MREYKIFIDDGGVKGLPVIFIHSAAGNISHWEAQLKHLRQSRRAIAFDLRGHGRSPVLTKPSFSIESFAEDLEHIIAELALERFVLVGHSLGGAISIEYSGRHPEQVAGLLLLDPASDGRLVPRDVVNGVMSALRSEAYWPTVEAYWLPMLEKARADVRKLVLADLKATSQDVLIGTLDALFQFDPLSPLELYKGPRLCIFTDVTDNPAGLHQLVPKIPQRKLDDVGHWLQLDNPKIINDILDEFLIDLS